MPLGAVMKDKAVAVGREHEGDIERHRIVEGLLHPGADAVVIVLGLDDSDRNIWFVVKDVVSALGLAAGNELSPDDDAAFGEVDLFADLHHPVPARALYGWADELGADIALAEVFLVHTDSIQPRSLQSLRRGRTAQLLLCTLLSNPERKQRVQKEITALIPIQDIP